MVDLPNLPNPLRLARTARTLLFRKRHPPVGAMPGTLVMAPDAPPPVIHLIRYGPDLLEEREIPDPEELRGVTGGGGVAWIDVHGLGDEAVLRRIGEATDLDAEQISLFIGPGYVLTFQERPGDVLDPVRRRIHAMRRDLLLIRRAVWPQREAVNALLREESRLVTAPVRQYLRDSLDHASQIADVVESYRDITSSLMDMYLSSTGQKTSEVMKVLTVMASIFIPLTFLAGVYGTNFHYLPELDWRETLS